MNHAVVEEKLRAGAEVAREAAELKARVEELEILLTQAQTSRREAEAQAQAAGWMAGHVNSKLINERDALARRALVLEAEIGAFPGKLLEAQGNAKRLREEVRAKQRIVEAEREARETIEQASEEVRAMLDDQRDEQARVLTTPRFTSTTIAFWRVMAERRISTKARKDHLVNAKAREEHWAQLATKMAGYCIAFMVGFVLVLVIAWKVHKAALDRVAVEKKQALDRAGMEKNEALDRAAKEKQLAIQRALSLQTEEHRAAVFLALENHRERFLPLFEDTIEEILQGIE